MLCSFLNSYNILFILTFKSRTYRMYTCRCDVTTIEYFFRLKPIFFFTLVMESHFVMIDNIARILNFILNLIFIFILTIQKNVRKTM